MLATVGFLRTIGLITNEDIIRTHKKLSLEDCGTMVANGNIEESGINSRCMK
jgi:hypothetical protein